MSNLSFTQNTIGKFSSILRYNVETYLDLYRIFLKNNYPLIYNYFTKPGTAPDSPSFDFLNSLIVEAGKLNALLKIHSKSFDKIDDWNLIDFIEDVKIKLDTISNTSKYTRSSSTKNSWASTSIQTDIQLKRQQTIEDVTLSVYNDPNAQNSWIDISVQNNLFEQDYSIKGGKVIQVTKSITTSPNLFLQSIVDNLYGDKLYGLDFNQKFNWSNNDLSILSYIDTVKQSVKILIGLRKGDIPEFPNLGVDGTLLAGNDIGALFYVSIIRQLNAVFASDDSLVNFNVNKFRYYNGVNYIDFSVDTFYNFTFNSSQNLAA